MICPFCNATFDNRGYKVHVLFCAAQTTAQNSDKILRVFQRIFKLGGDVMKKIMMLVLVFSIFSSVSLSFANPTPFNEFKDLNKLLEPTLAQISTRQNLVELEMQMMDAIQKGEWLSVYFRATILQHFEIFDYSEISKIKYRLYGSLKDAARFKLALAANLQTPEDFYTFEHQSTLWEKSTNWRGTLRPVHARIVDSENSSVSTRIGGKVLSFFANTWSSISSSVSGFFANTWSSISSSVSGFFSETWSKIF